MKNIIVLVILGLIVFSCKKPLNQQYPKSMDNLVVPNDFDWESTRTLNVSITSELSSIIILESYDTLTVYHKGFFDANVSPYEFEVEIPSDEEIVKVNNIDVVIAVDSDELVLDLSSLKAVYLKSVKTDNPISVWHLDDGFGTTVKDSEGGNDGSLSNANWVNGISGSALAFNGENSNVKIPNSDNMNPAEAITIMAWVKSLENKTAKIAQKGDWDGHGLGFDKWNGWFGHIRLKDEGTVSIKWSDGLPLMDEWYHLVMTYDGLAIKLYVNGQLKNKEQVSGSLKQNSRPFSIGSDNGGQKFFYGSIDEVYFYGSALSEEEILNYYKGEDSSDADGDGIPDDDDDYPNDILRAFDNYWPTKRNGTIMFEDLWPGKGDYDFNDLVMDFRMNRVCDAKNKIVEVKYKFLLKAIGASMPNGFGFQINNANILPEDLTVSGFSLLSNYISLEANGLESGQSKPTVIVFDDANLIMPSPSGFGVNVEYDKPYVEPVEFNILVEVTPNKYNKGKFRTKLFNPFLIVNKERGKEIHLPNYLPTDLVNASLFGSGDDNSDPAMDRYYKTSDNLPWALLLPRVIENPLENVEITSAYLKFYDWASSGGTAYKNWYRKKSDDFRDNAKIYYPPSK